MEEEKAAAYYDELTQKGSGATRFKQGLGFSSAATTTVSDDPPPRGSALPSSSFLSNFVKASSPSQSKLLEHQSQIHNIQDKLKKRENTDSIDRKSHSEEKIRVRVSDRDWDRRRGRSRSRRRRDDDGEGRDRRRRYRKNKREKSRSRSRGRDRRRSRSWSRERRDRREKRRRRSYSGEERRDRRKGRSRSLSPRGRKSEKRMEVDGDGRRKKSGMVKKEGNGVVDYAKLIDGFDKMTPAEKVKAKMKHQLSQTAEKDEKMGAGSQWERFDFDKDAPIEDEVLEAANDDAAVSKRIGQSFRFASLEGKREEDIRNAHDEAMFGVPAPQLSEISESENGSKNDSEKDDKPNNDTDADPVCTLLSEKVLSKQQGSGEIELVEMLGD